MNYKIAIIDTSMNEREIVGAGSFNILSNTEYTLGADFCNHGYLVTQLCATYLSKKGHVDIDYYGIMDSFGKTNAYSLYGALCDIAKKEYSAINMSLALPGNINSKLLSEKIYEIYQSGAAIFAAAYNTGDDAGFLYNNPCTIGVSNSESIFSQTPSNSGIDMCNISTVCLPIRIKTVYGNFDCQGTSYTTPIILSKYLTSGLKIPEFVKSFQMQLKTSKV